MEKKVCCVTGHRDLPQNQINYVKAALLREIEKSVADGFTCFMSGFAEGVDQYFVEMVIWNPMPSSLRRGGQWMKSYRKSYRSGRNKIPGFPLKYRT